ncbi:uncharacterized protein LOC135347838 isoform X2 [Halichondria panicea]|uniref:uncharacterized protein LOC135347838 isoform X2 n=1 Tax=Halichondria panicea TaxID=6063 RepID=UPI00312B32C7
MAEQDSGAQKKLAKDLWQAVDNNDVTKVRSLLGQGADPNHQLYWSEWADTLPPLHRACYKGYLEIVKTLVTHGARTYKGGGSENMTPLHWACLGGHKEVVQYLIEEVGCSTDVRDNDNRTPLHYACFGGSKDLVQYLVEELKMDIDVRDKWGQTPLHMPCGMGHIQLVKYLVEELKWDVDVTDVIGKTPLDKAVWYGRTEVADYLKSVVSTPEPAAEVLFAFPKTQDGELSLMVGDIIQDVVTVDEGWCEGTLNGERGLFPVNFVKMRPAQPPSQPPVVRDGGGAIKSRRAKVVYSFVAESPDELSLEAGQIVEVIAEEEEGWFRGRLNNKEGVFPSIFIESSPVPAEPLPEPGTPFTEEDSDALEKLLLDNNISLTGDRTYKTVVHHLRELGHAELADNLRANLDKVIKWQRRYLNRLMTLMVEKETIDICTLKLCLVGPPHVGKTTTLNRLLQVYENIQSAGDKAKYASTLLANCIQVMALINEDEWISSKDVDEEAKMIFGYLCGNLTLDELDIPKEETTKAGSGQRLVAHSSDEHTAPIISRSEETEVNTQTVQDATPTDSEDKAAVAHQNKLAQVILRLQKLIKSGNYSKVAKCLGNTLLNINDVGGQPEFLEMLPALSNGPAMYLVFLDLSKELDKPYDIPFNRDNTVITPYKSMHTVKTAVSQILSSIASVRHMSEISKPLLKSPQLKEKFEAFLTVPPVAALIGTHKDKLGGDSTDGPEKERLTRDKMMEINAALKPITKTFENILVFPKQENEVSDDTSDKDAKCSSGRMSFFALDNDKGTENAEISPLRGLMNKLFYSRFGKTSLPIPKNWLVLGIILRKEYQIATVADCIEIGKRLEMDEEETTICLLYLHSIGSILYYTEVPDDDDPRWLLKGHVICLPQVIFDSISQLIIVSMQVVHDGGLDTEFVRAELIRKGQFSLEAIERHCKLDVEVSKKLKNNLLIPSGPLVKLLKYLNLLSEITHKDGERITYLMPAILKCASQKELTNPPQPDTNNPEPLHITFSFGYVPTGVFCGLITRLVSQGPHGILGLRWELVENGVKRNCVSFYVDYVHKVTLLSHDRSYEIRVERNAEQMDFPLHDLCSHALSAILYSLKILFPKLILSVAFQCSCPKHAASKSLNNLCTLVQGRQIHFLCGRSPVTLSEAQQVWLGKHVCLGSRTELEVLKFAEDGFSFHWSKEGSRRQIKTTDDQPNTLSFPSVREEDFGHYQCEVKDAGKVLLTLYTALYKEDTSNAVTPLATPHTTTQSAHETTATAAQLSQECSDEALLQLSTEIAGYHKYKHRLGLSDAEIYAIDQSPSMIDNISGRFYTALKKWKSKSIVEMYPSKSSATYGRLVEIASEIEDGEAVRIIHKACVEHTNTGVA